MRSRKVEGLQTDGHYQTERGKHRNQTDQAVAKNSCESLWMPWGRFNRGWALSVLGRVEEGVAEMEEGITGFDRLGGVPFQRFSIALLAHGHASLGRHSEGLNMLDKALEHVERSGELDGQAEMLRLKGEMLLMGNKPASPKAEQCFRGSRCCEGTRSQMVEAARDDEPRAAARKDRPSRRSARDARPHLQLVHRRLRYRRPERRQVPARRTRQVGHRFGRAELPASR